MSSREEGGLRITLAVALVVLLPTLFPGAVGLLEYDRQAVARGELWRLVTCHFVHFGGDHLLWNLAAVLVLGSACELRGARVYTACTLLGAVAISLTILATRPELVVYRGYSGIASAVFVLLGLEIMAEARDNGRPEWVGLIGVVFASFLVKLHFEQATGRAFFAHEASAEMVTVPLAHTVGALVGLACAASGAARDLPAA